MSGLFNMWNRFTTAIQIELEPAEERQLIACLARSRPITPHVRGTSAMTESWRNRKTLILGRTDMMGLLTPAEYVDCVEHAFRMHGLGRVYMEPKGHIVLDRYKGEWEVMPSWIEEPEAAACKWVSIREDNAQYDLPAVFSILDLHGSRRPGSRSRSATARTTR